MTDFDINSYLSKRLSATTTEDKMKLIKEASDAKIADLRKVYASRMETYGQQVAQAEAQKNSWVGRSDLDPNSGVATILNGAASLYSGLSRTAGNIIGLAPAAYAAAEISNMSEQEVNAFNAYKQGKATSEDMAILNRKKAAVSKNDTPEVIARAQAEADSNPNMLSTLQIFERATKAGEMSRNINESFDRGDAVHQGNRDKLNADLGAEFQSAWDQTGLANMFEKDKQVGDIKNVAAGLGKLIYNAGEAAVTNPKAAFEYMLENAPQLFIGGATKYGKPLLTAMNAGYATDQYQQGLENYAAKNSGALPDAETRQKIAMWSAAAFMAEHLGELGQLKAIGKFGKAADTVGDAPKTGFVNGVKNTVKAAATGGAEEAVTEGFQTYAEGEAQLKPATAKDVYIGGVIGGMSGAGLSGAGHAAAEVSGVTPEKVAEQDRQVNAFKKAVDTADVSGFLDTKSRDYSPTRAVAALYENSKKEGTTQEQKDANLKQVDEIVNKLNERKDRIQEQADATSPQMLEEAKSTLATMESKLATVDPQDTNTLKQVNDAITDLKDEIAAAPEDAKDHKRHLEALSNVNRDLEAVMGHRTQLDSLINGKTNSDSLVSSADSTVDTTNPEGVTQSRSAIDKVITLSMAGDSRISSESIQKLVGNKSNGLTEQDRTTLRQLDEARMAENSLKTEKDVSQEVLYGSAKNMGLTDYRARITDAVKQNNVKAQTKLVGMLTNFAEGHKAKLTALQKASDLYQGDNKYRRIERNQDGSWSIRAGFFKDDKTRIANGGLNVGGNIEKVMDRVGKESNAINKMLLAMTSVTAPRAEVKPVSVTVKKSAPVAPSTTPAAQPAAAASVASEAQTKEEEQQAKDVESQLDVEVQSKEVTVEDIQNEIAIAEAEQAAEDNQGSVDATQAQTESTFANPEANAQEDAAGKGLDVLQDKTADKPYQQKNLIADYFKQSGKRPLVAIKDFMKALKDGTTSLLDHLNVDELTEAQQTLLDKFQLKARLWQSKIAANLGKHKPSKNDELFRYQDLMQFFIKDGNTEENVKTAITYAAFSYIIEKGSDVFNTPKEINAILNRDEDTEITGDEYRTFAKVGVRQNVLTNTLGQRAVEALGLKTVNDAGLNLMPQLQSAMGAHVMKLLLDLGIMQRTEFTAQELQEFSDSVDTQDGTKFQFVRLARDKELNLHPDAKEIFEASKGTKQILDNLFDVEPAVKEPSLEPIPFKQSFAKNSTQEVPKKLRDVVAAKNKEANYLRQDMWQILTLMGENIVMGIAGVKSTDRTQIHSSNEIANQAKNDALKREYTNFMNWVEDVLGHSTDALDSPIYFEHSVWNQQRVGISSTVINPQTSKVQRHLLYRKSWETTIDPKNQKQMDNFHLRVLEGFGVKTDKASNETNLEKYDSKVNTPVIQAAVDVLAKALNGDGMTEADQKAVLAGVQEAGENFHSLDALLALAAQKNAKGGTFKFQGMTEVDGVTNGPMLSHLLLGAANSVANLFGLLNRGGFFQKGSNDKQYNLWRGQPGNQDLYETTSGHVVARLGDYIKHGIFSSSGKMFMSANQASAVLSAVYAFTGELTDKKGSINKEGRNIIKTPLTAMVFGSSVSKAVDSMANNFIDTIYAKFEQVAAGKADREAVLRHLATLGVPVKLTTTTQELLDTQFSKQQVETLKASFTKTLGTAVRATMEEDFSTFMARRTEINQAAKVSFEIYNAVYTAIRKEFVASLDLPVNGAGKPIRDLTKTEEQQLRQKVEAAFPIMQTLMSKESNQPKAGLFAPKTERKLGTDKSYVSEVHFKTPFGDGAASTRSRGYQLQETGPGARMAVMAVHSLDSAISHEAADKAEVLNVHDAHGAGWDMLEQTARNLNQATWNSVLNYSPASEARVMLSNVLVGAAGILNSTNTSAEMKQALKDVLDKLGVEMELKPESVLSASLNAIGSTAAQADKMKFEAMSQMVSIDQYAFEGGNYEVTENNRAEAAKRADATEFVVTEAEKKAIEVLNKIAFNAAEQPQQTSPFGDLGKPAATSDSDLVTMLEKTGSVKARDMIRALYDKYSNTNRTGLNGFYMKLLNELGKIVPADIEIKYVTAKTQMGDVQGHNKPNDLGWFSLAGNQKAIYVLGQDFKQSNITPELMIHELLHSALAYTIEDSLRGGKTAATELVNELTNLLQLAKAYAKENGLESKFGSALSNVHELVSYGLTNKAFQAEVLTKIQMQSRTTGSKLISGMKAFINTLAKFLFKNPTEAETNGLSVLLSNTVGLLNYSYSQENNGISNLSLSMSGVSSMNTQDIYEALGAGGLNNEFDTHLRSLLGSIVDAIHGPWGTLESLVAATQAKTPLEAFHEAQAKGVVPFASSVMAAGFKVSQQEAFVIDQVEATVRTALEGNEGELTAAYTEMGKLYQEARTKFKGQVFADPMKQALVDFVFKVDGGTNSRSDYMSRFAALGMAHQEFREMLGFETERDTRTVGQIKGIPAKLTFLFNKFLDFFNKKVTHTFSGQTAEAKLTTLVSRLVQIENKRRNVIEKFNTARVGDFIEEGVRKGTESLRRKLGDVGESDFFQKSKSEFVKLAGNAMSIVGHDRAEQMIDTIAKYRDYLVRDKQGVIAGVFSEVRGLPDQFQRLLRSTKLNEKNRKNFMAWTAKTIMESFANDKMSEEDKAAVNNVFLRTDMASLLDSMSMEDITALLNNETKLIQRTKDLENQLAGLASGYQGYLLHAAKALGYFMVTGRSTTQNLMLNASNIANMFGTVHEGKLTGAQLDNVTRIVDKLATLYAVQYSDEDSKTKAIRVLAEENARTDGGNGISMIMNLHLKLQKDSRERVFTGSEALMMKGYLPDITDPNVDIRVVRDSQARDLIDQGYQQVGDVQKDPKDGDQNPKSMYVLRDGGLNPHTTGVFSLSSIQARGSEFFVTSQTHQQNIKNQVLAATNQTFNNGASFDPRTVKETFAVPLVNNAGKTVKYRYMMQSQTKDTVLRRDNRFEKLLGAMAGQTLDKVESVEQNIKAVKALKEFYEVDIAEHPDSYLHIGPNSKDPELREIYNLLPDSTKQAVFDVWGPEGMMVRNDLVTINFGYRKMSIADLWEEKDPNAVQHLFMKFMEGALYMYARNMGHMSMDDSERYKKRAAQVTRRIERMWQEVVHEMKDIIVMKTGTVMIGNILSNVSLLMMNGVPFIEIVKSHRIAMNGALNWQHDSEELFRLKQQLAIGDAKGNEAEIKDQIKIIEDRLSRNPVRELMEAGLMPSIVEDVAAEEDIYSYKTELVRKAEKYTSKLNPKVAALGRTIYMAHDTEMYKWLNHTTQLSDFVARYTLFQYVTNKKNALSKDEAIKLASDSFINYDIPSHRTMQYLDDMGIFMFSKYFLRIQKVLLKLTREHPTRVFGMMIFDHYFNLLPLVTESSAISHFGNNPFHWGAFQYPTVLDDLATVHAGLKLFK